MNLGIPFLDKIPARELGLKIQSLIPSGRKLDILTRIDASLLLFDNTLINTANGMSREVLLDAEKPFAEVLAQAARQLAKKDDHVLLLLPTSDFVATSYSMSISGEKMLRSALELQAHSLIPAYDEKLQLAVNARSQEGVALWFNENKANRLFRAFESENLFLSAIMPRSLALFEPEQDSEIETSLLINDEENDDISFVQVRGDVIRRLLTVNKVDLEQEVFSKQWELETSQLKGESVKDMTTLDDWQALRQTVTPVPEYCFLPAGAIQEEKRISFARRSRIGAAAAVCLVLLLFAPFISAWNTLRQLESELERVREMTVEPRRLQASIFDMEEEWGALYEYPDQQVAEVLMTLNSVIQSSLTSFSINEGVVDITGSTDDPAYLVELLAGKEEFYNVGQSTNTRGGGSQFGIRMNLSSVDFEAYEEKFPIITQGRQ